VCGRTHTVDTPLLRWCRIRQFNTSFPGLVRIELLSPIAILRNLPSEPCRAMAHDFQLFSSLRYDPALLQLPGLSQAGWNSQNRSAFYMLDFHRDRMLRAATYWGWDEAIDILRGESGLRKLEDFLLQELGPQEAVPKRVKVLISKNGILQCESSAIPERNLANLFPSELPTPGKEFEEVAELLPQKTPIFEVIVDVGKTIPSEYTHFKTTKRDMYDSARHRASIGPPDPRETLLVNEETGSIMEGTLTTPYYWRNGRWVTPPVGVQYRLGLGSGGQDGTTRRWALERYGSPHMSADIKAHRLSEDLQLKRR
jgi:4-amino-4-deoxychorismate lyase